ncbi:hypothetical protein ACFE04_016824 [Oxalis oulophora]
MNSSDYTFDIDKLLFPPPPPPPQNNHNSFDLNSKIMVAATISLSLIVTLVFVLHVYARYVIRGRMRQRAAVRHLANAVERAQLHQEPKPGLHPEIIAGLPIFMFKRIKGDQDSISECAVCLTVPEDDEMARLLPNCKHTFHAECIDKWLTSQSTCPICRADALPWPKLQLMPRESFIRSGAFSAPPVLESVALGEGTFSPSSSITHEVIGGHESSSKIDGSSSIRLSSFRRMLSIRRNQSSEQVDGIDHDIEMQ